MIDVRKEYEQDLLDAQIIWEQQEEQRYQAYLEEQIDLAKKQKADRIFVLSKDFNKLSN